MGDADHRIDNARAVEIAEKCYRVGILLIEMEKLDEAYALFCRGIKLNPRHALLQFALGQAFDSGLGVEKDDSKAVEWYRKAAEQGLMVAMYFLAEKLRHGQGVHDPEQVIDWDRQSRPRRSAGSSVRTRRALLVV